MLKQLFKNAFQPKEAKFGFNVEFVNGTLNHNPISNLQAGKCALNFEKQIMTIKQNNNVLTENMTDVESIRTWSLNRELFFIQFNFIFTSGVCIIKIMRKNINKSLLYLTMFYF